MSSLTDTIAAIATGSQRSAIGIVRLSGPASLTALERLFTPAKGDALSQHPAGSLVYGTLRDEQGRVLDRCLATYSVAPRSYTGEDTAELQCHGSPAVLTAALEALFALGIRQAGPGEFTRRAFLNGRMDLTQAEAVIDLIDAETTAAARCAAAQLGGAMSRKISGIYDILVDLMAHFHVVLDYSDEELEPFQEEEIIASVGKASQELARLAASYRRGRRLYDGVACAIVGRPNSGKSSLLNALLGYDRAIVTDIPGTTRDTVEEKAVLGGVLVRLIDTAGLRETADRVEQIGVERSRSALEQAELALVLLDGTQPLTLEDLEILQLAQTCQQHLAVITKADLDGFAMPELPADWQAIGLSARTGEGLEHLEAEVARRFPEGSTDSGEILTSRRQAEAVGRAARCLEAVFAGMQAGMTPDAVLSDVELALDALGEVTGRTVKEDVTSRIFERFCVGK
jgi:tRNA modification GTPase